MATSEYRSYQQVTATAHIPVQAVLLNNAVANTNGTWQYAGSDAPTIVTVEGVNGAFAGTVEIHGSTQPSVPADADNTRVILFATTDRSEAFTVPQGYRWIKARVTGYASGTIFSGMVTGGD